MNDINKSGTTTTKEAPGNDKDREHIEFHGTTDQLQE